jgi:hypothetical protein
VFHDNYAKKLDFYHQKQLRITKLGKTLSFEQLYA